MIKQLSFIKVMIQQANYTNLQNIDCKTLESDDNQVEIISKADDFFALRDDWNSINSDSPKGTVFTSWEWLYTWWETYCDDGNRQLYLLTCKNNANELLGIAPFQIINNPKRYFPCSHQLVLLGTGETDGSFVFGEYMDIIIKPSQELSVINSLSNHLYQHQSLWNGIKFHELLENSYLSRLFENYPETIIKTVTKNGFRTYIDLPDSYQDYLMSLQKKKRNNITRIFKRLATEQDYTIDTIDDVTKVDEAINTLAMLNLSRQDYLEKNSVFEQANFIKFHKETVKRLLQKSAISLRILRFSGEPVAALYSFIDKGTVHLYQSGVEEKNGHRYALMTTMLTQEISKSIENPALKRLNFMYSNNEDTYKKRYSGTSEVMYKLSYDKAGMRYKIYNLIHGPIKSLVKKILNVKLK